MDWRKLERHDISARYPDLKGQVWEDFLAGVSIRSVKLRPITMHEGKVLDGWQLLRACIAKDIEPAFVVLRAGEDPDSFVERVNDHRRHESQKTVCARAEVRRERVIKARLEGKSIRAIADDAGVSVGTVQNDLEVLGVQGIHLDPPDGQVTGLNGVPQAASKPKIYCPTCQTKQRKQQELPAKCDECAALRKPKPSSGRTTHGPGKPKQEKNGTVIDYKKDFEDAYGKMARLISSMSTTVGKPERVEFKQCRDFMNELMKAFKEGHKIFKQVQK